MKIAIVGDALSTRAEAPFVDPTWEIWGINHGWAGHPRQLPRCTRIFDVHDARLEGRDRIYDDDPPTYHRAMLAVPHAYPGVIMYRHPSLGIWSEGDVRDFPFEDLRDRYGREVRSLDGSALDDRSLFTSTVSWLIAFALTFPQLEAIGLWGIDMDSRSEFGTQRTGGEHWVGYARGRGVRVVLPRRSLLCFTPYLYGLEDGLNARRLDQIDKREEAIASEVAQNETAEEFAKMAVVQMQTRQDEISFWESELPADKVADRRAYLAQHEQRWRGEIDRAQLAQAQMHLRHDEQEWERANMAIPSPVKEA